MLAKCKHSRATGRGLAQRAQPAAERGRRGGGFLDVGRSQLLVGGEHELRQAGLAMWRWIVLCAEGPLAISRRHRGGVRGSELRGALAFLSRGLVRPRAGPIVLERDGNGAGRAPVVHHPLREAPSAASSDLGDTFDGSLSFSLSLADGEALGEGAFDDDDEDEDEQLMVDLDSPSDESEEQETLGAGGLQEL